jgi:hypothetical protein
MRINLLPLNLVRLQNNKTAVCPELTKSEVLQTGGVHTTVCLCCGENFAGKRFGRVAIFSIPPRLNCTELIRNLLKKTKIATTNVSCISLAALEEITPQSLDEITHGE